LGIFAGTFVELAFGVGSLPGQPVKIIVKIKIVQKIKI
jgi:hypothetical protein